MRISLVLAGRTIPGFNSIADSLSRTFHAPVSMEFADFPFTRSFRKQRGQYDAAVLLAELSRGADPEDANVFIIREDLFSGSGEFVFGMAKGSCALISTTRLDPRFYGPVPADDLGTARAVFMDRILKQALHMLGRIHGLPVCGAKSCVMASSDSISCVDGEKAEFCAGCRDSLHLEG